MIIRIKLVLNIECWIIWGSYCVVEMVLLNNIEGLLYFKNYG